MVENTSRRDPMLHLLGMLRDGSSGYIEGMEADGQRQVVASELIPAECPADELVAAGFTLGEPVAGDPLFRRCTLPEGWRREGSDHAMWSYILDERGMRRVGVFFKNAFYDRKARAHMIAVGHALATEGIYGDEEPQRPPQWDVMTAEEREDYLNGLTDYLKDAEKYPGIDSERAERARTLKAAVLDTEEAPDAG